MSPLYTGGRRCNPGTRRARDSEAPLSLSLSLAPISLPLPRARATLAQIKGKAATTGVLAADLAIQQKASSFVEVRVCGTVA